jgi:SecD/SecF fusion protein
VLGAVGSGDRWKKYDFIGRKRLWFAISGLAIVVGAFSLAAQGLNEGIDFSGGSQLEFTTKQSQSVGHVTDVVTGAVGGSPVVQGVVGATASSGSTFKKFQVKSHFLSETQQTKLKTALSSDLGVNTSDISTRNVSSSFGRSVLDAAILAVTFSLIIIFIYVSFRFEWKFAVPVMVALFHDLVITIGIYSVVGREVTADTVAAVLTVLGYSLYDTVIVFDRVRENIPILRRMTASRIVNESLAETITRSLNTSFVTLIPVVLLFVFGTGSLKDFAFALIVGIASGAYSSIFIAAPLLAVLLEREPGFVRRRQELARDGELAAPAASTRAPAPRVGAGAPVSEPPSAPPGASAPSSQRRRRRRAHGRTR